VKKTVLAAALVALMAVAAEAQVTLTYSKQNKNSSLTITYSSGYGYGYGYGGYGYGCGPVAPYGPGLVANVGGGTLTFGTRHVLCYPGYGGGSGFYGGGYGLYGSGAYLGFGGDPGYAPYGYAAPRPAPGYAPAPPAPAGGVSDRAHEFAAAKEVEEGRRRFRWGDYRGALDAFRSAVTSDPACGLAYLYFAAALSVAGDGRNADKALRSGLEKGPAAKATLEFRDEKERQRVAGLLGKVSGEGALAAAYALSLTGDAERLRKLAEKDPAAKKLLAP
jgi:hypothetical protein